MIFVAAVNGALRTNGLVAGKTKISELFLGVISTRILQLIYHFFVVCWIDWIGRLGDGLRREIFCIIRAFLALSIISLP